MFCYNPPRSILDFPPEVMVKIVNKLPYADVQSVCLTCWALNNVANAAMYGRKTALHKMTLLANSALEKCRRGSKNISKTRAQRLRALEGAASVKSLAGIIRVADASTFYFVLDGSLPPVPRALLTDLEEALSIATRRNPLVGRDRLERIFASVNRYLTMAMNSLHSPLNTSVFRSVIDIMEYLPLKTCRISHTSLGLNCSIYLNNLTITLSRNEYAQDEDISSLSELTAPQLIRFLANLNVKGIEEFTGIRMGNWFAEEIETVDATIDRIEMFIYCRPEQSVGVRSLNQICRLEPQGFIVFLHCMTSDRRPSLRNSSNIRSRSWRRGTPLREGEEPAFYFFSSWLLSDLIFESLLNLAL